jgi:hypothetical protein
MSSHVSRRRFWRDAALVAGVGALDVSAQPKPAPEVDARLANVIRKYGDRLSPDQREKIRKILTENEEMLAAVRAYPLENGDSAAGLLLLNPK